MTATAASLPLVESHTPADQSALAALLAASSDQGAAIYPIGGGTSLDYGLPATTPGVGISLTGLNRVIDYPARDMTVTVEAGITLAELAATLAAERQWLPVEGAQPHRATLGGLVATAASGPRRYGYGTLRDYVIGLTAVDVRGVPFKSGGRVVKNVAGYDFCKLLTGSLGTLAVVSQLTLKVRPIPERAALISCDLRDWDTAEKLLAALVHSRTTPVAAELVAGPMWHDVAGLGTPTAGTVARLIVGFEGTAVEVDWMLRQLAAEWRELGVSVPHLADDATAGRLWEFLQEFAALPDAPLVLKASVVPSQTTAYIQRVLQIDPQASIQAHAGSGIVVARFAQFGTADVSRHLIAELQPAAVAAGGGAVVLSSNFEGWTRQAWWGGATGASRWMTLVKQQFDPRNLLNPGRFAYDMG